MFFFGPKKDKNYFIAQKLFNILAEAAPEGLKENILLQKDMMKKAKGGHFFNTDYSLLFSYKMLYNGEPFLEIGAAFMDLPLASIRLKRGEEEFFADFFFNSKGVIFAVMFSKFPADDQFEVVGVDFYPHILNWAKNGGDDTSKDPFRISEKLVSILGKKWDQEYVPYEDDDFENKPELEFEAAVKEEIRQDWARFIHAEMPEDWLEFSRYFSYIEWDEGEYVAVFGYGRGLDFVKLDDGTAWYIIARFFNEESSINESFVLAAADPSKQGTLYYLPDHDVGAAGLIPIGNDLFGFLRKADDPKFLKSLESKS